MRFVFRLAPPAIILAAILMLNTKPVAAKPEYTRRTKQGCDVCHPPDSRALNEAGEYYRDHRSLDGFKPKVENKKTAPPQAKGTSPQGKAN